MPTTSLSTKNKTSKTNQNQNKTHIKTNQQQQQNYPLINHPSPSSSSSSSSNSAEEPPSRHTNQKKNKKNYNHLTRPNRRSPESQSTENLSSNTIPTPDLLPTTIQQQHHHLHPLLDQSNQLASTTRNTNNNIINSTTRNPKKRKPITIQDPPTTQKHNSNPLLNHHNHSLNHNHLIQSTPKRQKTEPIRPSSTIHQPSLPTRPNPIPAQSAPGFFFTTQPFKTPAGKLDPSNSAIANGGPSDSSPPQLPSSGNSKGKAKETRQISNHHKPRARSRSSHPDHSSSDDQSNHLPPVSNRPTSSSSQLHTPKHSRNTHIYGQQDLQADAEMSLVIAETPMHHKNRQFRRGGGNQPGKQKNDQVELGHGPGTPLSSQSLQAFDSGQGSVRRGSRASSIGSGHEALPHPRILPSVLCRHIRTDLPPSMRCRTLLSWCSQKAEHVTYTVLNPSFKPTRYIAAELPKPLARTLAQLAPLEAGAKSKLLTRVAKSALKNFIRGICENQVEISWGIPLDSDEDHEVSVEDLSILDLQALPPHPQDLKNERKIVELNTWRTRTSYEDHARQFQLNRYGRLIEQITEKSERTKEELLKSNRFDGEDNGDKDGLVIDTKRLTDRAAVLEFGRFLRSRPLPPPKSIDVLDELGINWNQISHNIGLIKEGMDRVEEDLVEIRERMSRLQMSSTIKLKRVGEEGLLSEIEAKIQLSSTDGVQLCLKSLNLNEPPFQPALEPEAGPGPIVKRDFLRTLSRSSQVS